MRNGSCGTGTTPPTPTPTLDPDCGEPIDDCSFVLAMAFTGLLPLPLPLPLLLLMPLAVAFVVQRLLTTPLLPTLPGRGGDV